MMKKGTNNLLESKWTPIICLGAMSIINEFIYGINRITLLWIVEVVLIVIACVVTRRTYNSIGRYIMLSLCMISLLKFTVDLFHFSNDTYVHESTPSRISDVSEQERPGTFDFDYNSCDQDGGIGMTDTIKMKCYHCGGSGRCSECGGSGKTYTTKYGIDLGGGNSTYQQTMICHLCDGERKCIWCNGHGYTIH